MSKTKFFNLLKAGYPVLWVTTHEENRCIGELRYQAKIYETYQWDIIDGLFCHDHPDQVDPIADPVGPLLKIKTMPETSVLFLKDFHKYLPSVDVFRALKNAIPNMKANDKHIVIVSPILEIPVEIEKDITVFEFDLPSVADLMAVAQKMVTDNNMDIAVNEQIIAAAKGLTVTEAEDAMAYSIIATGKFSRELLENAKLQAVKKSGLMEVYMPEPESALGGMDCLKTYLHHRKNGFFNNTQAAPKGIILTGIPGGGKSLSAKVCASIFELPLLKLDFSSLKGSLQGESDRNIRRATQLADAIGDCVIFMDEVEKSLGGVASSNQTDGGTTASMFGHLLTWMQETKSRVYIVATCNDMEPLLSVSQGALLRRFDDIFFIDVPSLPERCQILEIMNKRYDTKIDSQYMDRAINWTGAEIEKFVKSAIYDGPEFAFDNVHPIFDQNREMIEQARTWAKTNARRANEPEATKAQTKKVRRLNVS